MSQNFHPGEQNYSQPFSAWERDTNENMNGLIRQYIPKQREFSSITSMNS
jgi:IS30 family transposase